MDQYQTISLLHIALIQNALYTIGIFFMLWVTFRLASHVRGDQGTVLSKVLVTLFGLLVIWQGLIVFANRMFSIGVATKSLNAIKASGQALSVHAEAFLSLPFVPAGGELRFSLTGDPGSVIWWLLATIMLVAVVWMPVKKPA